jgi:hypothetical protein
MLASSASAQSLTTRVGVLQAEDRRAPTLQDLATLRAGARSGDPVTARVGLRALGRLERPALIPDITPGLRHALPEVRAEAANAIAQAAQGLRSGKPAGPAIASVLTTLTSRLDVEADAGVRAALCESMGRLPFTEAADAGRAEATLVAFAQRATTTTDRLGIAKGLEAFTRATRDVRPAGSSALDLLRSLARPGPPRAEQELLRESRVRRLALESLITAGATDDETVLRAADDPDPQVRRLAVRAALDGATAAVVARGLTDPIPMVRIEALRTARLRNAADSCNPSLAAASDPDTNVALVAIDQLSACGGSMEAVA